MIRVVCDGCRGQFNLNIKGLKKVSVPQFLPDEVDGIDGAVGEKTEDFCETCYNEIAPIISNAVEQLKARHKKDNEV